MGTVTLEIDGVLKYYINLHYAKSHPSPDPDTFDLRLIPEEASSINFFDQVVIKKDGVTEFVGFVEEKTPEVGEDGLEYLITGRCWKLLVWKKWTERYQESREVGPEDTEGDQEKGFFGQVYPSELIKFILRCPMSYLPKGYIRQKIGWGIPSDQWSCCASDTASAYYPDWVGLRYTGLAWRNRGYAYDPADEFILEVNGFVNEIDEWTRTGTSPYLDAEDDNVIHKGVEAPYNAIEKYFTFEHLNPAVVASITGVSMYLRWFAESKESKMDIYLSDGLEYHFLGRFNANGASPGWWSVYPRITTAINVSDILDTVDKVNAARIYFQKGNGLYMGVDYVYLYVNCRDVTDPGNQRIDDWFVIDLNNNYDEVTAIYLECRRDAAMYARNYKIQWSEVSNACENGYGDIDAYWHDFTPLVQVQDNTARDILHSWEPEDDVRAIRIKITLSADQAWEISQAYVWQADEYKFRVLDEGD